MVKLSNKIVILWVSLLCINVYTYASEEGKFSKEIYHAHYSSFKKYVFKIQSRLKTGRATRMIGWGAWAEGYDEFVISTCIPESYPLSDRKKDDTKLLIQNVGSDDNIRHLSLLLDECTKQAHDKNFVARTTYQEGKRLEEAKKNQGLEVSAEDRDTFVVAGLFVRYWIEHKHHEK